MIKYLYGNRHIKKEVLNMKLSLKNVGMIKNANIKLNGITVIAGKNGTGKAL